ncbi:E3 ubiquitin-protein ligase rfwd3.S-like [Maniola hyperantus]|uniref:E3 ubiquitin-protein ligase rfwd3.S-like n=1 Tax=Aphantopus hyperantus TaxID=2795564 RepID=UPI003748CE04
MEGSELPSSPSILVPESPESSTDGSPGSPILWQPDYGYDINRISNASQGTRSNDSHHPQPASPAPQPILEPRRHVLPLSQPVEDWIPVLDAINEDTQSNDSRLSPDLPLWARPLRAVLDISEEAQSNDSRLSPVWPSRVRPLRAVLGISEEAQSNDSSRLPLSQPIVGPLRVVVDISEEAQSNDRSLSPGYPLSQPVEGPLRVVVDIREEARSNDSSQSQPGLQFSRLVVQALRAVPDEALSNESNQSQPGLPVSPPIEEPWRAVPEGSSEDTQCCGRPNTGTEGCEEPPTKVRKLDTSVQDDGETCPICLDSWGNSGPHRLVSLKCGHLFGAQCVARWLRAQPARERRCPSCKSRATLKDMRFIYAKKLVAADCSQVTALQAQIDMLQQEKNRSELELQKSRIAHRATMMQLEDLRRSLLKTHKEQPVRRTWRFALEKNLEINKDGGCRVMTYNCRTYELYVSQRSTNPLFPGYGIRKVSCVDYKLGQFLHLHPKPIRDITYSQPRDLLLSVGLDNTARIVERGILSSTIQCGLPLWSCTWDYLRSNEFYVGGTGGVIQQYDIRNSATYIKKFNIGTDLSPVVSLVSTEHGLLSCQLNSCWLWTSNLRQWERRSLPVEGPFMSLCYDDESHRVLVSSRAGAERAKLHLCKVKSGGDVEHEQVFGGSARTSVMCRSAFVKVPGSMWVAAHSESDSSLDLYGLDGCRSMRLPASEPAVAVCAARVTDTLVASLSEARLRLYRAQPSS